MLTREHAATIFDQIRRNSSADEVELLISGNRFALTRFANNTSHQNVEDENHVISVRTNFGGRTARASTNKFDDESLKRVVEASENLARVQQPAADLLPMPSAAEADRGDAVSGGRAPVPSRYFAETAAITPDLRAVSVRR